MFNSRLEMAKHYDELMNRTNDDRRLLRRQRPEDNLVKTYVLELHSRERRLESREQVVETMERLSGMCGAGLVTTDDWLFFGLHKGPLEFYVEVTDPRFLLLHTHVRADLADSFLEGVIKKVPALDQAWLPSQFLLGLGKFGMLRGFKLRHDNLLSVKRGDPDRDSSMRKLSLSLTLTEDVRETLEELRSVKALRHALNMTGVEVRVGEQIGKRYALDEVFNDGKLTARGTSFTAHHDLANDLCTNYGRRIREVEDYFSVSVTRMETGITVNGLPFEIEIDPALEDLEVFCRNLLSGSKPFRLWGIPHYLSPDYITVTAVDLHAGHQLMLEISPDFMRVYMPSKTCGNTVFRLFTGLQQHLARSTKITYGGETFDLGISHN